MDNLDSKNKEKIEKKNNEGLGPPSGENQAAVETTPMELDPSKKAVTENLAAGVGGVAGSGQEHTDIAARESGTLTTTQRRNLRRKRKSVKDRLAAESVASSASAMEKGGGTKRTRSDVSTPSPSTSALAKKTRTDFGPSSFASAVKSRKMAVVKDSFPNEKLSSQDSDRIQLEILEKIDSSSPSGSFPKFQGFALNTGALIFYCDDDFSVDWLTQTFNNNSQVLEGATLKVLSASDLPKPVKVAFRTRDVHTKEPSVLLRRLNMLNPRLKSVEWRFLHKIVEAHSIRWIFEVDMEAAEAIKQADFGAYTGLDRGTFKILRDPNKKSIPDPQTVEVDPGQQTTTTEDLPGAVAPPQVCDSPASVPSSCDTLGLGELELNSGSDDTLRPDSPLSVSDINTFLELQEDEVSAST